jgi:hypothetical protein
MPCSYAESPGLELSSTLSLSLQSASILSYNFYRQKYSVFALASCSKLSLLVQPPRFFSGQYINIISDHRIPAHPPSEAVLHAQHWSLMTSVIIDLASKSRYKYGGVGFSFCRAGLPTSHTTGLPSCPSIFTTPTTKSPQHIGSECCCYILHS